MWNWKDIMETCSRYLKPGSGKTEAVEKKKHVEPKEISKRKWNNMGKIKVLVISDTHRNVRKINDVMKREKQVDLVLHMGDLEGHGEYIRQVTKCPLEAVRGNCDYDGEFRIDNLIEVGGHMIFMTHGHRYGVDYGLYELEDMARGCGADIAMYGHTHQPYFEKMEDGFVILNPGSLGSPRQNPRRPSYMIMEVDTETGVVKYYQQYLSVPGEGRIF